MVLYKFDGTKANKTKCMLMANRRKKKKKKKKKKEKERKAVLKFKYFAHANRPGFRASLFRNVCR